MNDRWLTDISEKGFAIFPALVNSQLVDAASQVIREQLEADLMRADGVKIEAWTNRSFVPDIESDPRLLDLYRCSPLAAMCAEALEPYAIEPISRAQVQVRLSSQTVVGATQPKKDWHCDGIACPHLPAGRLNTFQLLAGILLSDLPHVDGGALRFRVGGHLRMAQAFRNNMPFQDGSQVPADVLELPVAEVCGAPGDVLISHHMTPHAVGANGSGADRVMVYFRLRVIDHDSIAMAQLTDPWVRMPKLAAIERGREWQ